MYDGGGYRGLKAPSPRGPITFCSHVEKLAKNKCLDLRPEAKKPIDCASPVFIWSEAFIHTHTKCYYDISAFFAVCVCVRL